MRKTRGQSQLETRQRLIMSAHAAIMRDGIGALSLRGLCDEAGYSQGAFYSNFAGRDDLLVALMERPMTRWKRFGASLTQRRPKPWTMYSRHLPCTSLTEQRKPSGRCWRSSCSSMRSATPGSLTLITPPRSAITPRSRCWSMTSSGVTTLRRHCRRCRSQSASMRSGLVLPFREPFPEPSHETKSSLPFFALSLADRHRTDDRLSLSRVADFPRDQTSKFIQRPPG